MRKSSLFLLILAFVATTCFAQGAPGTIQNNPIRAGAFYGTLPFQININSREGYPTFYSASAGSLYLRNKKISELDWVGNEKTNMIKAALKEAKDYATKNNDKYYAVDNMHFQIVSDQNKVSIYFDCNVIAW